MKTIKKVLFVNCLFFSMFAFSQTQTFDYITNTTDWLAFDGSSRLAGNGWNTVSYSTQNWVTPFDGNGSSSGTCIAPYDWPAGSNGLGIAIPVIWSRQTGSVGDTACFRRIINLPSCGKIIQAIVTFAADDNSTLFINGVEIGTGGGPATTFNYNSQQACTILNNGVNIIAAEARDVTANCMSFTCGIRVVIDTTNCCTTIPTFGSCSTNNVPRRTATNTFGCSQVWDDGTGVVINNTFSAPRVFTGVGVSIVGSPANPTTASLDVRGLTFTNTLVVSSDKRLKKDIKPFKNPLEKLLQLQGVRYMWDREAYPNRNLDNSVQAGFLAQDVEKIFPEAVFKDNDGFYAMNYNAFIPLITEAIKEQNKKINELEEKLAKCGCNAVETYPSPSKNNYTFLEQNIPNPLSNQSEISYFISLEFSNAKIMFMDLTGKLLKSFEINQKGNGKILINSSDFQNGMYIYSLVIDGKEVDSKKMQVVSSK